MKKGTADLGLILCLCFGAASIALLATGMATHHWLLIDVVGTSDDIALGLFKLCFRGTCVVYDDHSRIKLSDDLKRVRSFCITAAICYGLALLTMLVIAIKRHSLTTKTWGYYPFFLCGIGGIFAIAGVAHFVKTQEDGDADPDRYEYGYSLYLTGLSVVPAIIAGVVIIFVARTLFEHRSNKNGQVVPQINSYVQSAGQPIGVMTHPQTPMAYDNPVMMSNMNPGQSKIQEKQGPPPSIVDPGAPSNVVYGAGGIQGPPSYTP